MGLANIQKQSQQAHSDRHKGLEDAVESERNKRLSDLKQMEEVHNTKGANLQSELTRLEALITAAEKIFKTRHNELGSNLDSKFEAVNRLVEERFGSVESRLDVNEAHTDANTIGLEANNHTATTSLSELRRRVSEAEGSLECSVRAQKEMASKVNATAEQLTNSFRTESTQRCLSFRELETKVNEELLAIKARTEEIRKETMHGYNLATDNLDRSLSARHEACVAASSQQVINAAATLKSENERTLVDFERRLDEVSKGLQVERNNHAKWMEEERAAIKKCHEEHMRCVEVERDARLRQATELRSDVLKLISKDRDDRFVDTPERRSDAARRQALKSTVGSSFSGIVHGNTYGSGLISAGLGAPTVSHCEPGTVSSITAGASLDTLLRSTKAK